MVGNVTSLTNNGLKDWLLQRFSALILGAYAFCLSFFLCTHPQLSFGSWQSLFQCLPMKIFTVIVMLSFVVHAWIGIWTVSTDYLKCSCIRLSLQALVVLYLLTSFVWVLAIVWSVPL
jgi:succinate dehydrogenase membrane anchor subunit